MRLPIIALAAALLCPAQQRPAAPFERIDAHVHVAPPPEAFLRMLERLNVRVLNVTLVDPLAPGFDKTEPQTTMARTIAEASRGRIGWVSTFDPSGWQEADFGGRVSSELRKTFAQGAVAVKMYKSVGMYLRSADGRYVLPDDPAFAPVLETIAAAGKPLLAHLAEPRASWQPPDPASPHYGYYQANPDWYMYRHPERPSWETIIAARDRMLARHPKLRVVGCHLGSMEHDVDEIARRLDKYPNFAVDTAARVPDLMRQPREKVRAFCLRYQDRILWGTDLMELRWDQPARAIGNWEAAYEREWRYFARDLALPEAVLRKIFRENALRWIPGSGGAEERLPSVDEIASNYLEALGGEAAVKKIATRAAEGSLEIVTYGDYGRYREVAKAPNRMRRTFAIANYGVVERCYDGARGWEETPEYGTAPLEGVRLEELRRQASLFPALDLRSAYAELSVVGRVPWEDGTAFEVSATTPGGARDTLWFNAATGLLAGVESTETFRGGVSQRSRMLYEDYRSVDGVQVPHVIRYESPRMVWMVRRGVAHNVPVAEAVFQ
ncbi:MAG: amidohydrolase family protein [Acidobacteriota bacterium]